MRRAPSQSANDCGGFGVVEIVIGSALISLALIGLIASFQASLVASREAGRKLTATFLAEEGMEAARLMRDRSWTNISGLSTTTTYYLTFTGGTWATTTVSSQIFGTYYRTVRVSDVYRNGSQDIAASGTGDARTKKITADVSWQKRGATTTVSLSSYLADIF
ncbi:MAG: hypothetical protein AAB805_01060 [Patescibacteria group bacterium]